MLERIFYLEEYGQKLEEKLKRKIAGMKSRLDTLSGELKGYEDSTDEALDKAGKILKAAVSERKRVEKELKELEARYNEAREIHGLLLELEDFNRKEEQHLASKELIDEKRALLEKAVKAGGLREMILSNRELAGKLDETGRKLSEALERLQGVESSLDETRAAYEKLVKEMKSERPKLAGKRAALSNALILKGEIASLTEKAKILRDSILQVKAAEDEKTGLIDKETSEYEALSRDGEKLRQEMETLKIDPDYRLKMQEGVKAENEIATMSGNINNLAGRKTALENSKAALDLKLKHVKAEIAALVKTLEEQDAEKQKHEESKPGIKIRL